MFPIIMKRNSGWGQKLNLTSQNLWVAPNQPEAKKVSAQVQVTICVFPAFVVYQMLKKGSDIRRFIGYNQCKLGAYICSGNSMQIGSYCINLLIHV